MAEIYQDPESKYQLYNIGRQLQEIEDAKARRTQNLMDIGTSVWGTYQREQALKAKEMVGTELYEYDPAYIEKNWIQRQFTPSGGRVQQRLDLKKPLTPEEIDMEGPETIGEQIKGFGKGVYERGKDILDQGRNILNKPALPGATTTTPVSNVHGSPLPPSAGSTAGAGVTTGGQVLSGVGFGMSAWDLATNWKNKSKADKGFGIARTALGGAGMVGALASGPVGWGMAGLSALDWLID